MDPEREREGEDWSLTIFWGAHSPELGMRNMDMAEGSSTGLLGKEAEWLSIGQMQSSPRWVLHPGLRLKELPCHNPAERADPTSCEGDVGFRAKAHKMFCARG